MKLSQISLFALCATLPLSVAAETTWVDEQHKTVRASLHNWSNDLNDWLGETDPSRPASASLRIMLDNEWNRYDKYSFKPRVRGKIKLPVLKKKLSLVFGDDSVDNEVQDQNRIGPNYRKPLEQNKHYDRRQTKDDNSSIALRWSEGIQSIGLNTDFDVGIRAGSDVYFRFTADKLWKATDKLHFNLEQIYRFGLESKHFARTNFETRYHERENLMTANHLYYEYTHKHNNLTAWGNSLYRQHTFANFKRLNYGFFVGGSFDAKVHKVNQYGPFINWRQPVLRKWLFIQPELNFYNNRDKERNHTLGAFLRVEAIF